MTTPVFVAGSGVHAQGTNTIALNAGSNAGRTVIVCTFVNPGSSESVTGITYGGTSMTEMTGSPFTSVGGTQWKVQGFYLKNAASGSNNLVITQAVGSAQLFVTAAAYDTCDTSAPVTNVVTFDNTAGSAGALNSGAITSASGNLAVVIGEDYASGHSVDTFVDGTGVSNRYNHVGDSTKIGGFVLDKAGAASVTITDTLTCSDAAAVNNCFGFGFNLVGTGGGAATAITLSGPSSGATNVASTNFTVGANGTITGTPTVTPTDSSGNGTFTPSTVNISSGTPTATFTYTPTTNGARNINCTNNGSLSNPSNIVYTASAGKTITLTLITSPVDFTPRTNLSGLKWAWFDNSAPNNFVAPTDTGSAATTDNNGLLTITLVNTTKTSGQVGWLVISNSDGTVGQTPVENCFSGPVALN